MKKQHTLMATAAISAAVLILAGCSSSSGGDASGSSSSLTIAGVYENTQDAFWASFVCGAQDTADKLGVKLQVTTLPTADNAKLTTAVDSAMLTEPDGLVVNPIDPASWDTKIGELMKSGVPVVTSSNSITTQLSYVQADQEGGPFLDQVLKTIGPDVQGKAIRLLGLADAEWQNQRLGALTDGIKAANSGLTFLDDQIDGFDVNKGTQLISSIITANPDLKVILGVAGPEGQAIAAAIKQTGATGITVISYDAVPAEVDALRAGTIQMLIAQPAYTLGGLEVQALVDFLNSSDYKAGEAITPMSVDPIVPPVGVLNKDNVDTDEGKALIYTGECS